MTLGEVPPGRWTPKASGPALPIPHPILLGKAALTRIQRC